MSISYDRLWKLLIDKKINKTQLKELAGISTNAVAKLGKNESVSLETLEKICVTLNCDIGDIVGFVQESEVV
jgi:DNA (cytosine-5)-methyltransferase 1